jgi:hypothetical protein
MKLCLPPFYEPRLRVQEGAYLLEPYALVSMIAFA